MPTPETPGDPIRKSLTVPLDPMTAFRLFTEGIDRWWPKETHSLAAGQDGGGAKARVRVEPREGGKVIETLPDGQEAPWGDVTHWQPGERVALRWYVGRSPEEATLVDIRFTPVDAGTRVDLVHSGFAVHGAGAAKICAGYTRGWDQVLGISFGTHCAAAA